MIETYNQRFYPNPFRYRKLKNILTPYQAFDQIQHRLQPFLKDRFSELHIYIDDLGEWNSEIRLIRIIRKKINKKLNFFTNKLDVLTNPFTQYLEDNISLETYQKNLRYLELPVQPLVDEKGFELQFLSNEIVEEVLEEIEDGYSSIYEYCSNKFPEAIELWGDYALSNPNEFPFICHDDLLETSYEVFDTIIEDLQKTSLNLFNWTISGDMNTRILKVIKSKLPLVTLKQIRPIVESTMWFIILILVIKYLISKYNLVSNLKSLTQNQYKSALSFLYSIINKLRNQVSLKKLILDQKTKRTFLKISKANFKIELKYQILQLLTIRSRIN